MARMILITQVRLCTRLSLTSFSNGWLARTTNAQIFRCVQCRRSWCLLRDIRCYYCICGQSVWEDLSVVVEAPGWAAHHCGFVGPGCVWGRSNNSRCLVFCPHSQTCVSARTTGKRPRSFLWTCWSCRTSPISSQGTHSLWRRGSDKFLLVVFQISVATTSHPVRIDGLHDILSAFPEDVLSKITHKFLVFVVPKHCSLRRNCTLRRRIQMLVPNIVKGFQQYVYRHNLVFYIIVEVYYILVRTLSMSY